MKTANPINGILLLNKPQGITSNKALQKVKFLFGAKKAGHTGSLDPLATGMLPICFGEATKISQYLLDADKCYDAQGLLGIKTNTADATGQIINEVKDYSINKTQLLDVLDTFTGKTNQIPSMFSALKHNGVPLYKLARKGLEIDRPTREIEIRKLKLNFFDGKYFSFSVHCSKGTYIRNLIEDIGSRLQIGAHMTQLHRTCTAGFANETMYALDELEQMPIEQRLDCLIPIDRAIDYLPLLTLSTEEVLSIRQGRTVPLKDFLTNPEACLRLYDENAEFIGLGEYNSDGYIKAKRLLAFP